MVHVILHGIHDYICDFCPIKRFLPILELAVRWDVMRICEVFPTSRVGFGDGDELDFVRVFEGVTSIGASAAVSSTE
jgi:hypothetical protein